MQIPLRWTPAPTPALSEAFRAQLANPAPSALMAGVDTSVAGMSNQGHEFGVDLSEPDREALIGYLESI